MHLHIIICAIVFILAALSGFILGGFILIYKDLTGKPIPKWLAVDHGIASLGLILLLFLEFMTK